MAQGPTLNSLKTATVYETDNYVTVLNRICIDESCGIEATNSGCSALADPEDIQALIRRIVPKDKQASFSFRFTGMQCVSSGCNASAESGSHGTFSKLVTEQLITIDSFGILIFHDSSALFRMKKLKALRRKAAVWP